jgi:hypothetical protein
MANPLPITLLPSEARSGTGSGSPVDIGEIRSAARLVAMVSTLEDEGTVALSVQTSPDGTTWSSAGDFEFFQATGHTIEFFGPLKRFVRVRWEIAGDDPATFEVSGNAHVVYCDPADISRFSLPERALDGITNSERVGACIAATDISDGYVGGAYKLPLVAWGDDLRAQTAKLAGAQLLRFRGVDPEGPDAVVFQGEEKATEWLNRLANGRLSPPGIIDQTPAVFEGGSVVVSRPRRGW